MADLYFYGALFLLLNMLVGLARALRGPTMPDRMLSGELMGTTAVALLLLLSVATDTEALVDVALIFALLSVLAVATFVRRTWSESGREPGREPEPPRNRRWP